VRLVFNKIKQQNRMNILTWNKIELYYYQNEPDTIDMVMDENGTWIEPMTNMSLIEPEVNILN
jgi:hypothetical protein